LPFYTTFRHFITANNALLINYINMLSSFSGGTT
jgi:hypothetical protein